MHYMRIMAEAVSTPWAILPAKLAAIQAFLRIKSEGGTIPQAEIDAMKAAKQAAAINANGKAASVAVVPVYGTIVQRADLFTEISGGVSTVSVGEQIDKQANDPAVKAIILDIHSPGGTVYGVGQLAEKIASVKSKPVIGVANSLCASAAYWIASACSELVVTSDAEIGSIGVYQMTFDETVALEAMGVKPTMIKSTELKASGNPYEPLTDAMRAELQKGVDDYYQQFVNAVAKGRKTTPENVAKTFGAGGTLRAREAVYVGMADSIGTLEGVIARYMTDHVPKNKGMSVEIARRSMLIG